MGVAAGARAWKWRLWRGRRACGHGDFGAASVRERVLARGSGGSGAASVCVTWVFGARGRKVRGWRAQKRGCARPCAVMEC